MFLQILVLLKLSSRGYANLINRKNLPVIEPVIKRGVFELNETLIIGNEVTDLKISEVRNDYIKIDGKSKLKVGDRIVGRLSGVSKLKLHP